MCVTMLLLRDRFGCGVTFPLRDFLVCVAVYTENDSGLRTCREREGEGDGYAGGERPAPRSCTCTYQPEEGAIISSKVNEHHFEYFVLVN